MILSVIIPTLNEHAHVARAIENLKEQSMPPEEIIVVDGGSNDGTKQIAKEHGAFLLEQSPPVARQMNWGAFKSAGELLLFLHADCILQEGAIQELRNVLSNTPIAGGAFKLQMRGHRPWLDRYLSWSGSWNARRSQLFLGDHGIFCRRTAFQQTGGFPEIPLMYELDFMRKLKSYGKLVQLNKNCIASARRFESNGYWKTILLMRSLRTLYKLGLPISRLERIYQSGRPSRPAESFRRWQDD
jgi:rSAM/selenodomain-associated transferase 2